MALGLTCYEIAQKLNTDVSMVYRIICQFRATGDVSKRLHQPSSNKLSNPVQLFILNLIVATPGIYLREIQKELKDSLGVEVDKSTIWKFLHKNSISRQKMRITAIQRNEALRQKFICDVSVYNSDMLVFLDETGADRRNHKQKVWLQCKRKLPCKPAVAGKRTTSFCHGGNLYEWFAGCQVYKRNYKW